MGDNISKLFGLDEQKEQLPAVRASDAEEHQQLDLDAEDAGQNIKVLIETGNRALEEALNLAIDTESPRAFEVLTNLISTLGDLNLRVLEVHSKKADIKKKNQAPVAKGSEAKGSEPGSVNTTNNIIFNGTTTELAKYLEEVKKLKPFDGDVIDAKPRNN